MASLDHFVGRPVEEIVTGEAKNEWGIKLEGGVVIWNTDKRRKAPTDLTGTVLARVDLTGDNPVLEFRQGQNVAASVTLSDTAYRINGRGVREAAGGPRTAEEAAEHLPPDPSSERVAHGPAPLPEPADA